MREMNRWIVCAGIGVGLLLGGCQPKEDTVIEGEDSASKTMQSNMPDKPFEPEMPLAARPVDLSLFEVPVYPGSVQDEGMEDRSSISGELVTMVVSRTTTDSLENVKGFYKEEVEWTDSVEMEDGAGFILKTDDGEESVSIADRDGKRVIVITKLIDNREESE